MKRYLILATLLLASAGLLAQTNLTSPATSQSGQMSQGMGSAQSQNMAGMHARMQERMQQMQANVQEMKSRIAKMRSDAEKVQDPNTKAALLDNADMWDQFVNQIQSHMQMMEHRGMHHGGMMNKGMMKGGMKGNGMMQNKTPQPSAGESAKPNPQ